MRNTQDLFKSLLNGDTLSNDDGDRMNIIDGNVIGIDKHGVKFPVKWFEPTEWSIDSK